ncbi:hypothetical protein [Mesorhizobium onobrychidis]|uniref:hypothetical protein n=1 Tax=Mesorhizobium onobrychidis TaxID=2775404 RepID=UPI002158843E|nr:hypothetical protein [Mesorhizobium onobrychidis]
MNDAVSASRTITVTVTVDKASKVNESWSVGKRGRKLVRDGVDGITRLVSADRLKLSWRFGLLARSPAPATPSRRDRISNARLNH